MAITKTRFNGIEMSIRERDELIKLDYIRGAELEELASKYMLGLTTLKDKRGKGGWAKARKAYEKQVKQYGDHTIRQVYAGHKAVINVKYNQAWQKLMSIIEMVLDNPKEYLFHPDGDIRWGAMQILTEILEKAQKGQERANGVVPKELEVTLDIQREKMLLLRGDVENPQSAEDILENDLVKQLNESAKVVFADFKHETSKDIAKKYRKKKA